MAAVADLERLLERMFERTSARLFHSRVQAVQVERRVERAMEAGRTGRGSTTSVPSRYRVRLHPADLDDVAARTGGPEALAARLAEQALAFARLHAYHLASRPTVSIVADPSVERGRVEVESVAGAARPVMPPGDAGVWAPPVMVPIAIAGSPSPGSIASAPVAVGVVPPPAPRPAVAVPAAPPVPAVPTDAPAVPVAAAAAVPPPDPVAPGRPGGPAAPAGGPAAPAVDAPAGQDAIAPASAEAAAAGLRGDRRSSIRPAAPPPPRALLRVTEPGGSEREVRVEGAPLTLGRAPDNSLVIADRRVSRHHGRFQSRHGTLVYTDLGSTNGTRVNGIRVDEIVLGAGDRIQLGDVVVVVEQLPG
jgi:hypothetical protein